MSAPALFTLAQQIACVKREIAMRERVYPKWVSAQKMRQSEADHEIAAMKAVLGTLMELKAIKEIAMADRGAEKFAECGSEA